MKYYELTPLEREVFAEMAQRNNTEPELMNPSRKNGHETRRIQAIAVALKNGLVLVGIAVLGGDLAQGVALPHGVGHGALWDDGGLAGLLRLSGLSRSGRLGGSRGLSGSPGLSREPA